MTILSFDKPEKVTSPDEHNKQFSSDSGVAGTYVPNMSKSDQLKYKAKLINKGKPDARVEIRKTFSGQGYSQVLVIVGLEELNIKISMNGAAIMTFDEFDDLHQAIEEAKQIIFEV